MANKFTQSFKIQAIQKALSRTDGSGLEEFSRGMGVGYSTLQKWIRQSKNQELEASTTDVNTMKHERRPQDWSAEERLDMIIQCAALDEAAVAERCRQQGVFPHHITEWKANFSSGKSSGERAKKHADTKELKLKIKQLEKELNRKDKALAETAALLVLQKKVQAIWGCDEDSSL
jgi:transposase-like protein